MIYTRKKGEVVNSKVYTFSYNGDLFIRLDKFLVECLSDFSRSRLQMLIENGYVLIDNQPACKSSTPLQKGQNVTITIPPPEPTDLIPEKVLLDVIFENDDLIIVNKPAGMVVHPSIGHFSGTLIHAAISYIPELLCVGGKQRPGVVHRLDKDTSGLIILAKNDYTHHWLQDQFRQRSVKKVYLALVDGTPPTPTGRIEAFINRDPSHRQHMAVVPTNKGREAITEYFSLQNFSKHTFLEVHPLTGRTHQIRVHLAFIQCPIVGDTIYGHKRPSINITRHFLHATRLEIILPGKSTPSLFEAPLPDDLNLILTKI